MSFLLHQWVLYIAPTGGWNTSWVIPAMVVLVIGSLLLAVAAAAMALYRADYLSLLESLLPRETLKKVVKEAKMQGRVKIDVIVPGKGSSSMIILNVGLLVFVYISVCMYVCLPRLISKSLTGFDNRQVPG